MSVPFELEVDPPVAGRAGPAGAHELDEALAAADEVTEKELLATFRKATRLDPGDPDYHYILAGALAERGRHQDAVPAYEEAIRLHRGEATYHSALGVALWRLQRLEEAQAAFQEALRLSPQDARALNGLGTALLGLGRPKEAVTILGQALGPAPRREQAHVQSNLGAALWALGRKDEALAAFREARRLGPEQAPFHRNLGRALGAVGRVESSLECFEEVVRLRPDDADAHLDLADALLDLGRHAEAEAGYAAAAALDPQAVTSRPRSREAQREMLVHRVRSELEGPPGLLSTLARLPWAAGLFIAQLLGHLLGGLGIAGRRVGAALGLVLVCALGYLGWAVLPPYVDHYLLRDDMVGVARAAVESDAEILERLMHAVRERGLEDRVRESSFQIHTRPRWRTIRCDYEVSIRLFPGLQRTLHFTIRVEEPHLTPLPTQFL